MIATQNHSQAKMLFLLDFLCNNLRHPCNTPATTAIGRWKVPSPAASLPDGKWRQLFAGYSLNAGLAAVEIATSARASASP
jgi:hypothetical protein